MPHGTVDAPVRATSLLACWNAADESRMIAAGLILAFAAMWVTRRAASAPLGSPTPHWCGPTASHI